jgi:hypothetical protein
MRIDFCRMGGRRVVDDPPDRGVKKFVGIYDQLGRFLPWW